MSLKQADNAHKIWLNSTYQAPKNGKTLTISGIVRNPRLPRRYQNKNHLLWPKDSKIGSWEWKNRDRAMSPKQTNQAGNGRPMSLNAKHQAPKNSKSLKWQAILNLF